ncbi:tetratricopeptide repeat protein [Planctomycetota bacterium]|nr:tetratricopeptide repeat protein [Planctomycetota bacterium]
MNPDFERAQHLYSLDKYELAEEHFRRAVGDEPENAEFHSSLARCLSQLGKHQLALEAASTAIHLDPDDDWGYFVLADVLEGADKIGEAIEALELALQMDPEDSDYWSFGASLYGQKNNWLTALEYSDRGLELDSEHSGCIQIRALCLQQLGRKQDASSATEYALAQEPNSDVAHHVRGLVLLEAGDRKQAMYHFRESLRLDPNFEPAKEGIILTLKAANPLYRPFLSFMFWISRKGGKWIMGLAVGLFVLAQFSQYLGRTFPEGKLYFDIFLYSYAGFILLIWYSPHFLDAMITLHPLGRIALSRRRKIGAATVLGMLAASTYLIFASFGEYRLWRVAGFPVLFLTFPVSGYFQANEGLARKVMMYILGICLLAVALPWIYILVGSDPEWFATIHESGKWVCVGSTWIFMIVQNKD